ncbi:MAG: hypothetical protein CMG71_00905 [Candidatus Marinimicrobia bacterium]|nr:hypothetical protein [Candidatus Neomarinimicrobiota bacterium]
MKKIYLVFAEGISLYGLKRYYYFALAIVGVSFFLLCSVFIQKTMTSIFVSFLLILGILLIRAYLKKVQLQIMLQQAQHMMEEGRCLDKIKFVTTTSVGITQDDIEMIKKYKDETDEVILAEIDKNGRAFDIFGVLGFLSLVKKEDFIPKDRFKLNVVLKDNYVLVSKSFEGDNVAFIHEWFFLSLLQLEANVPAVWGVDKSRTVIYMNFIQGKSLNEMIAEAGGEVRQSESFMSSKNGNYIRDQLEVDRSARVWGKRILDDDILSELSRQLDLIHSKGIVGVNIKPGNVVISKIDGNPYIVDFHSSRHKHVGTFIWRLLRDRDRLVANRRIGLNLLTEKVVNNHLIKLKNPDYQIDSNVYAPIDFGEGHAIGAFWNVTSGTGRWEQFMKKKMPSLKGKRILDLGSNNGCMPLMMLQAGAHEVIGIELSSHYVNQSNLVKEIFEWRDLTFYNFKPESGNMLKILDKDYGEFDLVTALCTLYYLNENDMIRLVNHISHISHKMVVQAIEGNVGSQENPDKPRRASVGFLINLLRNNGFERVSVSNYDYYDPRGCKRPILIGERD